MHAHYRRTGDDWIKNIGQDGPEILRVLAQTQGQQQRIANKLTGVRSLWPAPSCEITAESESESSHIIYLRGAKSGATRVHGRK